MTIEISTGDVIEVSDEMTTGEIGATLANEGRSTAEGFDGKKVWSSLETASAAIFNSEAT